MENFVLGFPTDLNIDAVHFEFLICIHNLIVECVFQNLRWDFQLNILQQSLNWFDCSNEMNIPLAPLWYNSAFGKFLCFYHKTMFLICLNLCNCFFFMVVQTAKSVPMYQSTFWLYLLCLFHFEMFVLLLFIISA